MSRDTLPLRRIVPSLHSLGVFEAAARYLNFSKAAKELSITQPAVSHAIRQLESAIGLALFVRERRALSLTTHGHRLYSAVAGGLTSIAEVLDDLTGTSRRETVVVGSSTAMATEWLLPRLADFRATNPNIIVNVRCLDRDPDLTSNNIDVHIRLGDGHWPGYEADRLWPEYIAPVCSPSFAAYLAQPLLAADLLTQPLIHYTDPYRFRMGWAEWFKAMGVPIQANPPIALQVNDSLVAQNAAELGEGIALSWFPVVERALRENRLVKVMADNLNTGRHFFAVTNQPPHRRRVATLFRDWLVNISR